MAATASRCQLVVRTRRDVDGAICRVTPGDDDAREAIGNCLLKGDRPPGRHPGVTLARGDDAQLLGRGRTQGMLEFDLTEPATYLGGRSPRCVRGGR